MRASACYSAELRSYAISAVDGGWLILYCSDRQPQESRVFTEGPLALARGETSQYVKPAPFAYHRPDDLEEAVALLGAYGPEAKVLAGGQSLVPLMNFRLARPAHLVDINRLAALEFDRLDAGRLSIGALTRHRRLTEADFRGKCLLLSLVSPFIGHPQIRARGTLGGSAAHADSSAELPGALLALDAEMVAISSRGQRVIAAEDFFVHYMTTSLADDEILTEVRIRRPAGREGCGFGEVAARHGDFALVGSMVRLFQADGAARADARVVVVGCGPTPLRIREAEHVLTETGVTRESVDEAAAVTQAAVSPSPRAGTSQEYLVRLAGTLTKRAILQAEASLLGHDSDH